MLTYQDFPYFECQQQQECFNTVEASVNKVSHEKIVGLRYIATHLTHEDTEHTKRLLHKIRESTENKQKAAEGSVELVGFSTHPE